MFSYVARSSLIHKLNPMTKLLTIGIAVFVLTLFFDPVPTLFMTGLALFSILVLARIPARSLFKGIIIFLPVVLGLTWVNTVFSRAQGQVLVDWGLITITDGSLRRGVTLGLRLFTIILFSYLFAATTDPRDLTLSMVQQARVPYKVAFGVLAGFRFLPLLSSEFEHIRAAHRIRGTQQGRGWRGTYHELRRALVPLFASVIRKSYQIGLAMEGKGFGAYNTRTSLIQTRLTWLDLAVLLALLVVLAVAIYAFLVTGYITRLGPQFGLNMLQ